MSLGDVALFDRFASIYDRVRGPVGRARLDPALELADRPIERVLDVGGGSGQGVRSLEAEGIVVDASPGMCRRAAQRDVAAVRGDAAGLPVADESVDAVLILDALHHMADQEGVIQESARVLRPGGVLVVLEYDPTTLPGRLLVAAEHLVGFDSTFLPPGNLESLVRRAGLKTRTPLTGFEYAVAGVRR